jgi:hypothetical protein
MNSSSRPDAGALISIPHQADPERIRQLTFAAFERR